MQLMKWAKEAESDFSEVVSNRFDRQLDTLGKGTVWGQEALGLLLHNSDLSGK